MTSDIRGRDRTGLDALVVGGGPAGSVSALLLARAGLRVHLLDRCHFPRPKPCGESLNPGAVALLHELGLWEAVSTQAHGRMSGWTLSSPRMPPLRADFDPWETPGSGSTIAVGIPRLVLDAVLLEAARDAGVEVSLGWSVDDAWCAGPGGRLPGVSVRGPGGETRDLEAQLLVGADGLRSRVRRALGWSRGAAGPHKTSLTCHLQGRGPYPHRGSLLLGGATTLGLAPLNGDGSLWNATLVLSEPALADPEIKRELARDPAGMVLRAAAGAGWNDPPEVVDGPWASGAFHQKVHTVAGRGALLVGDAAGYYDPLTGQGIYRSLQGARLLAEALVPAFPHPDSRERALRSYARRLRRGVSPGRRLQRVIEFGLARPRVRDGVLGALSHTRAGPSRLVRVTGDLDPLRSLLGIG